MKNILFCQLWNEYFLVGQHQSKVGHCNIRTDDETNFEYFFSCLFPTSNMFVKVDVFFIYF